MVSIRSSLAERQMTRRLLQALRYSFWISLCMVACLSRAADPNLNPMFEHWFAAQTNIQSWSADFTQTRTFKTLAQPLVSTGKVMKH